VCVVGEGGGINPEAIVRFSGEKRRKKGEKKEKKFEKMRVPKKKKNKRECKESTGPTHVSQTFYHLKPKQLKICKLIFERKIRCYI
jgi:hypothetical protein